ncbi:hypothetical protein EMCG_02558 [[Emmonsia] crescens]|uniref:Aminoglycoside phosphotransferase domain-containing protein n=1 Tax=[Emmonsia] crescens TaxID=73230 RepID=A0A0G2HXN7_9EURO|nr:hypothetical protein EMCG_02558 [Emmonsia crescens UAMH 3008]
MHFDSLACDRHDIIYTVWHQYLEENAPEQLASKLATLHCKRPVIEAKIFSSGSYNQCFRVKFYHGPDVLVRFPMLGSETAIMMYIAAEQPSIPVPKVLGNGTCDLGPYLILGFVEGELMVHSLQEEITDHKKPTVLNMGLDMSTVRKGYREMARMALALFNCKFTHVGAVRQGSPPEEIWSVETRALTFNMNELIGLANYPPQDFHKCRFSTSSEYFVTLANYHLQHLKVQRNDAIIDEADCRKKYVARCLFRKIAREFCSPYDNGPFPLFCDDFRPSNVIVDKDLNIRCLIDWEFCYAAPAEFTHCSPWWLLLARPEDWIAGLDDFLAKFLPKHEIFLEVLREYEQEQVDSQEPSRNSEKPLSEHMRESMETGLFWFCLAARSSFGFDNMYWNFIDQRHFGKFNTLDERLELLTEEERNDLEPFVQLKLEQKKEKFEERQTLDELMFE